MTAELKPLLIRLREAGNDYTLAWGSGDLYDEAADEIERLNREAYTWWQAANEMGKRSTSAATASGHELQDAGESRNTAIVGPEGATDAVANAGDARVASAGCAPIPPSSCQVDEPAAEPNWMCMSTAEYHDCKEWCGQERCRKGNAGVPGRENDRG